MEIILKKFRLYSIFTLLSLVGKIHSTGHEKTHMLHMVHNHFSITYCSSTLRTAFSGHSNLQLSQELHVSVISR